MAQLDKEKMMNLMKTQCNGNYNLFARELGLDPGHLHRFLNTGVGGGKKMIFGLMDFCGKYGLDYRMFM